MDKKIAAQLALATKRDELSRQLARATLLINREHARLNSGFIPSVVALGQIESVMEYASTLAVDITILTDEAYPAFGDMPIVDLSVG